MMINFVCYSLILFSIYNHLLRFVLYRTVCLNTSPFFSFRRFCLLLCLHAGSAVPAICGRYFVLSCYSLGLCPVLLGLFWEPCWVFQFVNKVLVLRFHCFGLFFVDKFCFFLNVSIKLLPPSTKCQR